MAASIGCAIHCAAMPLVIASLPAWGLSFLADEAFHQWMAVVCIALALAAFVPGWQRHRRLWPVAIGGVGLALICGAAFGLAGDCCPSCPSEAALTGAAAAVSPGCGEGCCESASGHDSGAVSQVPAAQQSTPTWAGLAPPPLTAFLTRMAPWLTPLGGLFLVAAHLLNHRFGCLPGCCERLPTATVGAAA